MKRMFGPLSPGWLALAGALAPVTTHAQASPHYRIAHELPLPGDEGWDYLAFEAGGPRLFTHHAPRKLQLDTRKHAPAGEIAATPGTHRIQPAPAPRRARNH